ncbi:MAG: acetyltransferase-like isoleucine patch superfamily enzyme [Parvicellaceae bacterium]|jgi:acetyltransferase-like isoleucine patch superfamily enzyme
MVENNYKEYFSGIKNVTLGENVTFIQPVNVYDCRIGDNTFVGPFVEIQSDVNIGSNCKIQSHSFICSLVDIGNDTFIGHGVIFINDLFTEGGPAQGNKDLWRSTSIGNNVSIGSNATILPVSICDQVVVGAGAVVTKDIKTPGKYVGNPAKKIEE